MNSPSNRRHLAALSMIVLVIVALAAARYSYVVNADSAAAPLPSSTDRLDPADPNSRVALNLDDASFRSTRRGAPFSAINDPSKEHFGFLSPLSITYSIAPGATLDISPVSNIFPPGGYDYMEVTFGSVPGVSHGTMYRVQFGVPIPWGSGVPNPFEPGWPNDRISGGGTEGFRYTNNGTGAGTSENIPVNFRNLTGTLQQANTIVISIDSGLIPPTIVTQPSPLNRIPVNTSSTVTVVASDNGQPPLSYQWYEGFAPDTTNPAPGVNTNATYTTPVLTMVEQKHYYVRVTTPGGSVNSDGVTVQVEYPTTVTAQNAVTVYGSASHSIPLNATGTTNGNPSTVGNVQYTCLALAIVGTQSGTVVNGVFPPTPVLIPAMTELGAYSFTAFYQGPAGYADATDSSKTITVDPAPTTTTAANAIVNASTSSQVIPLSATVTSAFGPVGEGTVTFTVKRGAVTLGSPVTSTTVSGDNASVNYTLPAGTVAGVLTIQAVYNAPATNHYITSTDTAHTLTVSPVITASTALIPISATSVVINGLGFDPAPGNNAVAFNSGTGTVTSSSYTQITVSGLSGLVMGYLDATCTTNGAVSNTPHVAIVVAPPTISKQFGGPSVPINGSIPLTFTITNPNSLVGLTGVDFNDPLPPGLVVADVPNITGSCGTGMITAAAGASSISLSGGTMAPLPGAGFQCILSVDVKGITAGTWDNTTNAITSTEGATGVPSNTATLNVLLPPTISKSFGAQRILPGGTSSLTFVLSNPTINALALTGAAFNDGLPAGLTVASPNGLINNCGGSVMATPASGSVSLSGGTIPVNLSCSITVNVTGTTVGFKDNTTGAVSSTNGGTGMTSNTARLTVASPPTVAKSFAAPSVPLNGTTTLTFTLNNPNAGFDLHGVNFSDNFPAGLEVADPAGIASTCTGTWNATPGDTTLNFGGGTLSSGSCTLSVNVKGVTPGAKLNTANAPQSDEGGAGVQSNTATLNVFAPPTVAKAFAPSSVALNGTSQLTITITNPPANPAGVAGVAVSDNFPTGMEVAAAPNASSTCGGTFMPTAGATSISLTGGTLPSAEAQCSISVAVKTTLPGDLPNTTGNVSSTQGGLGTTSNTAMLRAEAPPTLAKAFVPDTIAVNGTTSLNFTITNPAGNLDPLTGVGFTDMLPTGLTVASGTSSVCGGTLTITAPTGIALAGASVNPNGQCQFNVTVTGTVSGQYTNTTSNVTSTNGGTGNAATAGLTVANPVVSGRVTYENTTVTNPVDGVAINGLGTPPVSTVTDADGNYSVTLGVQGVYTVMPSRPAMNCNNATGIMANDASLVAQYVVGITPLTLTQRRAADVAGLGPNNLSSYEAALIARWMVCINTPGSQTGQWKFSPVSRTYSNITSDQTNQDYQGLLMGDVTGDWTSNLMLMPEVDSPIFESLKVAVPKLEATRGTPFTVPLSIGNLMGRGLSAYQFDMEYDPSVITPAEVAADLTGTMSEGLAVTANSPEPGLLKVVVYGALPVHNDGIHVNMHFIATGAAGSQSPLTIRHFRANDGTIPIYSIGGTVVVRSRPKPGSGSE